MKQQDFQYIAESIRPRLMKLCAQFFDIQELAYEPEDAVQETFLRLWQSREQLDGHQNPEGLAVLIAKNVCIDIMKRGGTQHDRLEENLRMEAEADADQQLITKEEEKRLAIALGKLPATQRRMLLMRSEGMTMAEIAIACYATKDSTKTMICAARKKMMELLKLGRSKK